MQQDVIDQDAFAAFALGIDRGPLRDRLQETFRRADMDSDGSLCRRELKWLLSALRPKSFGPLSNAEVDLVLTQMDKNGDGTIQYEEFVGWATTHQDVVAKLPGVQKEEEEAVEVNPPASVSTPIERSETTIRDVFRRSDKNGDGVLSKQELKWALRNVKVNGKPAFQPDELDRILTLVDSNGDGVVQYNEFVDWMMDSKDADSRKVWAHEAHQFAVEEARRRSKESAKEAEDRRRKELGQHTREFRTKVEVAGAHGREVNSLSGEVLSARRQAAEAVKVRRHSDINGMTGHAKEHKGVVSKAYDTGSRIARSLSPATHEMRKMLNDYRSSSRKSEEEATKKRVTQCAERLLNVSSKLEDRLTESMELQRLRAQAMREGQRKEREVSISRGNRAQENRLEKISARSGSKGSGDTVSMESYFARIAPTEILRAKRRSSSTRP